MDNDGAVVFRRPITCHADLNQSAASVQEAATYSTSYCACPTSWIPEDADVTSSLVIASATFHCLKQ